MLPFPSFSSNGLYKISNAYPGKRRQRWFIMEPFVSPEFRLIFYVLTLYTVFISWGYLQEKISSNEYEVDPQYEGVVTKWGYPFVLNVFMSTSCFVTAALVDGILQVRNQPAERKERVSFKLFWKVAITSALASPIGYESLKYISFPMMILSKSSKHVPVMFVGKVFYGKHYALYKYASVAMVCAGISLFTLAKSQVSFDDHAPLVDSAPIYVTLYGLLLVMINLSLDGITSNEQDRLFAEHGTTSMQMMKNTNCWQAIYLSSYLLGGYLIQGTKSAAYQALRLLLACPEVRWDILGFCVCACLGQVLLFGLIREFGSLVWITVSVTRQLFTILLSIFLFNHPVNLAQWGAVLLVFGGLIVDIAFAYHSRPPSPKKTDEEVKDEGKGDEVLVMSEGSSKEAARRSAEESKLRSWSEDSTWDELGEDEIEQQEQQAKKTA